MSRTDDLISRADAIKAVREYAEEHTFNSYHKGMLKAVSIIADIPSADRPRGEWIDSTELTWTPSIKCSNCGAMFHEVAKDFIAKYGLSVANDWNFCPNCGADMKGADDE